VSGQDVGDAGQPAEPGARLRARREELGLSEQQAAEQLNLDSSAVAALERNDFAALGVAVFARGHLRRYATLLGLPEEAVLEAYDHSRSQPGQPSLIPKARLDMAPVRARPKWPLLAGSALLFLVAAGLAAYITSYGFRLPGRAASGREQVSVVPGSAEGDAATGKPATLAVQTNAGQTSDGSAVATAPETAAVPPVVPGPGQVVVRMSFAADSWVEIYDGAGRAVVYDLGQRGTQRTVVAAPPLSITLGNARAVAMQVNGRKFAPPPPPAGQTVARFGIGPDGNLR
jgi:cytoskeleton protein RodZ